MSHPVLPLLRLLALASSNKGDALTCAHFAAAGPIARQVLGSDIVWGTEDAEDLLGIFESAHDELNTVEEFERRLTLYFEARKREHARQGSLALERPAGAPA